jgi:membrane-associated phospholipid phosphatase
MPEATRLAARASLAGAGLFLAVLADTLLRGPLSWGLQGANDAVSRWRDAGVPVHEAGTALSLLGDWRVLIPVLCTAAGALLALRAWRRALAFVVVGALTPLFVGLLHHVLTPLNVPVHGLDPFLVPDIPSPPRKGGEHLFPSGHVVNTAVAWGFLAFGALPPVLEAWHVRAAAQRRARLAAAVAWAVVCLLAGAGRLLRQAHAYNDVLAGLGLGAFVLFGTLWAAGRWLNDARPPNGAERARPG